MRKNERFRRRGSMYIVVLGSAMTVTVVGLSALTAIRVERRSAESAGAFANARYYARSAIEKGFYLIENDPTWRRPYSNDQWVSDKPIGFGKYTLLGVDPGDGDLEDSNTDPVDLTGIGVDGPAKYMLQVTMVARTPPLEALQYCLHAAGQLTINPGKILTATNAPVSTNGNLRNDGALFGDAEAITQSGVGAVSGTAVVPAEMKDMPDAAVVDTYEALATKIIGVGLIDRQVLSPGNNPWGATNTDGVYCVTTGGSDLVIQDSRIHGTLLVRAMGRKVVVDQSVFMQSARSDYPVLIVDGDLELLNTSDLVSLSETDLATNFNPAGAPYGGVTDTDQFDVYPNEVRGLVHVKGNLTLANTARVRGAIICEGTVLSDGVNEIIHDRDLYTSPPMGYTAAPIMEVSQGTWRQTVTVP